MYIEQSQLQNTFFTLIFLRIARFTWITKHQTAVHVITQGIRGHQPVNNRFQMPHNGQPDTKNHSFS